MRIYLPAIFLLFALELAGQPDYSVEYFPFIHKAELKIVTAQYKTALNLYKKAFKNVNKGFSVDYTNAAVCAAKTGKYKIAFQYLNKLIDKGVERTFFDTFPGFATLRNSDHWENFTGNFEALHNKTISPEKIQLRKQITSLEEADQEFRIMEGSYTVHGDTIKKIDARNVEAMELFIRKYGFPNENIFGISIPSSDIPGGIVFHHHCQGISVKSFHQESIFNDFIEEFIGAIKLGEAEPHRIAFYISQQGDKAPKLGGYGLHTTYQSINTGRFYHQKHDLDNILEINRNRKEIGLEPLEEYFVKSIFVLKDEQSNEFILDKYSILNLHVDVNENYFIEIK